MFSLIKPVTEIQSMKAVRRGWSAETVQITSYKRQMETSMQEQPKSKFDHFENFNFKLEIWGRAQLEAARHPKSIWKYN